MMKYGILRNAHFLSRGNIMDITSTNLISKKIAPLLLDKKYERALTEVRNLLKKYPTNDLKAMEIIILRNCNNYSDAIKIGTQYFNNMEYCYEKADMATALQLVYMELGDGIMIKELGKEKIIIYESIINNSETSEEEINLVSLNLSGEYLRLGYPKIALKISNAMLRKFRTQKTREEFILPLYGELVRIHAKLYNRNKVNLYKAKIIAAYHYILKNYRYPKGYRNSAKHGLYVEYKMIGTKENALMILKHLEKELKKNKNRNTILKSFREEINNLY